MISEADNRTPLLCLLSTGSDPTNQIEALAKNLGQPYQQLSMGQGQEEAARKMMSQGMEKGQWIMLQNCHLSVEFCDEIIQTISDTENVHDNFKMWITTEINKQIPMSLLQMSIKVLKLGFNIKNNFSFLCYLSTPTSRPRGSGRV